VLLMKLTIREMTDVDRDSDVRKRITMGPQISEMIMLNNSFYLILLNDIVQLKKRGKRQIDSRHYYMLSLTIDVFTYVNILFKIYCFSL